MISSGRSGDFGAAEQSVYRNLGARAKAGLEALPRAKDRTQADSLRPALRRELTPPDLAAQLLAAPRIAGLPVNPVDGGWNRKAPESARKTLSGKLRLVSGDAPDEAIARFMREAAANHDK